MHNINHFKGLNENSVINHPPSCSISQRPFFIFGMQIKMFYMIFKSYLTLHRQQESQDIQSQRKGNKNVQCDFSGSTIIIQNIKNIFVHKKKPCKNYLVLDLFSLAWQVMVRIYCGQYDILPLVQNASIVLPIVTEHCPLLPIWHRTHKTGKYQ